MDLFRPVNISLSKLVKLAESNPEKLFEKIRRYVERELSEIKKTNVYDTYFNPKTMAIVVEYFIKHANEEISLKIIYSNDLAKALKEYYEYEKSERR